MNFRLTLQLLKYPMIVIGMCEISLSEQYYLTISNNRARGSLKTVIDKYEYHGNLFVRHSRFIATLVAQKVKYYL